MSWKDMFVKPEEEGNDSGSKPEQKEAPKKEAPKKKSTKTVSFPTEQEPVVPATDGLEFPSFSTPEAPVEPVTTSTPDTALSCDPHIDKVMQMYEKGFQGLNKPGYDFYEYLQGIESSGGAENPAVYQMAFNMAKSMAPDLSKNQLVADADDYIGSINEVHAKYDQAGQANQKKLNEQEASERNSLQKEVSDLDAQIKALQAQLSQKQAALSTVDEKYNLKRHDLNCNIQANNVARDRMVSKITQVKNGIISNVK